MEKIKCCKCQKFILNKDYRLEINGKDYHKSCYCKSDSEKDDKNKLREYIISLYCRFNEEIPQDAKINTLILQAQTCMITDDEFEIEYCQNRKLSFEQLYKIMEYAYKFENKTPKFYSRNPFSVVPYYYYEQLKFEEQCKGIKELVDNFEFEDKVIVIKKSRTEKSRYKEIDMSTIGVEDTLENISTCSSEVTQADTKKGYVVDLEAHKRLNEQLRKKKEQDLFADEKMEYYSQPVIEEKPNWQPKGNPFD